MCIALLSIYQRHPYNCGFETDMIYYSRSLICTLNVRNSDEISASIKPCPFWYCVHFGWDTSFRLRKFLNIAQTFSGHVFNKNTSMMQPFITLERQFIIPPTTLFLACENDIKQVPTTFFFQLFSDPPPPYGVFLMTPSPCLRHFGVYYRPPPKIKTGTALMQ